MSTKYDAQLIIVEYRTAYRAANGKEAPVVTYEHGWFKIGDPWGASKHRRLEIEEMTKRLTDNAALLAHAGATDDR